VTVVGKTTKTNLHRETLWAYLQAINFAETLGQWLT
jgi:hypothetical protein